MTFSEGIEKQPLRKICENSGFDQPLFSRIRTESTILFLRGKMRVSESLYFCIIYAANISLGDFNDEWNKEVAFKEIFSQKSRNAVLAN